MPDAVLDRILAAAHAAPSVGLSQPWDFVVVRLAATVEQMGVGWVSFYREAFLRELLAIPAGVRPVAWLCLGPVSGLHDVPDLERHRWSSRRPLQDVRHEDRWGGRGRRGAGERS